MNEQIQELEEQLEDMPQKKLYFIYVSIVALLVFMSWNLFGESMNIEITTKENSIKVLEKKLEKNSVQVLQKAIDKTYEDNLVLKEELNELNSKDIYINNKLESIDFVFFDQMGIAHILDDILKQSVRHSVDIKMINYTDSNKLYKSNIYEKEKVDINGIASFANIMNLVQYIDSLNALLKINNIDVYIDENQSINFTLDISHYGVEL